MIEEFKSFLTSEVEHIVKSGTKIRERVATTTAEAAVRFHETREGFLEMAQAVKDGAIRGVQGGIPDESESKLRHVIGGLVDGLGTAAEAIDLSLKESVSAGKQFTKEDLSNAREELKQLKSSFAHVLTGFGGSIKSAAGGQAESLGSHASAAARQVIPMFEDALTTLVKNVGAVANESGRASVGGVKGGAGALLDEIGSKLTQLGQHLDPKKPN